MEYGDHDLRQVFDMAQPNQISKDHVLIIIYNILCSLKFLKSANVVHRDLKPANILINDNCHVKLCDFGLSRTLPFARNTESKNDSRENNESTCACCNNQSNASTTKSKRDLTPEVGTRWYRPPEVILK
jgi:mitogen-activated protein kinase 1/3